MVLPPRYNHVVETDVKPKSTEVQWTLSLGPGRQNIAAIILIVRNIGTGRWLHRVEEILLRKEDQPSGWISRMNYRSLFGELSQFFGYWFFSMHIYETFFESKYCAALYRVMMRTYISSNWVNFNTYLHNIRLSTRSHRGHSKHLVRYILSSCF